jgi:hypothetical protein
MSFISEVPCVSGPKRSFHKKKDRGGPRRNRAKIIDQHAMAALGILATDVTAALRWRGRCYSDARKS